MKIDILTKKHDAFTLLEMVFVITILGIVAALSSEVIAKTYESYINQKALSKTSMKTELVATQIANRLAYAIPESIVARNGGALTGISDIVANDPSTTLQWIGYDIEGFTTRAQPENNTAANRLPGWSGFIDLGSPLTLRTAGLGSPINLSTPGSNLPLSNAIINTLSAGGTPRALVGSALYMPVNGLRLYNDVAPVGYVQAGAGIGVHRISATPANNVIQINAPILNTPLTEQYKIAWTSYAIVPVARANGNWDLWLHYNFQPWNNEVYNGAVPQQSLLLTNVSVFRFTGSGNSVRFKLCTREYIGAGVNDYISVCKEKVVIR